MAIGDTAKNNDSPNMVLLLDDDQDLLDSLKMIVETTTDRKAITARSMNEVLSLEDRVLKTASAILDINLGFGQPSGIDVYRWLRSHGYAKPITFLTGHARTMPEVMTEVSRLGDAKVYSKPIDMDLFIELARGE